MFERIQKKIKKRKTKKASLHEPIWRPMFSFISVYEKNKYMFIFFHIDMYLLFISERCVTHC